MERMTAHLAAASWGPCVLHEGRCQHKELCNGSAEPEGFVHWAVWAFSLLEDGKTSACLHSLLVWQKEGSHPTLSGGNWKIRMQADKGIFYFWFVWDQIPGFGCYPTFVTEKKQPKTSYLSTAVNNFRSPGKPKYFKAIFSNPQIIFGDTSTTIFQVFVVACLGLFWCQFHSETDATVHTLPSPYFYHYGWK